MRADPDQVRMVISKQSPQFREGVFIFLNCIILIMQQTQEGILHPGPESCPQETSLTHVRVKPWWLTCLSVHYFHMWTNKVLCLTMHVMLVHLEALWAYLQDSFHFVPKRLAWPLPQLLLRLDGRQLNCVSFSRLMPVRLHSLPLMNYRRRYWQVLPLVCQTFAVYIVDFLTVQLQFSWQWIQNRGCFNCVLCFGIPLDGCPVQKD